MRYYEVSAGQEPMCYSGEFAPPYPDLDQLFLGSDVSEDVRVTIRQGNQPGDMIFGSFNVVSQRMVDVLEAHRATGYQPFPVTVSKGTTTLRYWGLKLLGRGGRFDAKRSEARYSSDGRAIFGYNHIYMDEEQWDGSDVFAIRGLGIAIFVTERVKEALERANLFNVRIVLNTDCYLGGPRLREELAKRRRELGLPDPPRKWPPLR